MAPMDNTLIIRLKANKKVDWALQQGDKPFTINLDNELADIPKPSTETLIIATIPAEDVTIIDTNIPKSSYAKQLQAAPFAMENLLATNITDMHFALGTRNNDGTLPVACITQKKMQHWLDQLATASFIPHILIPETLLLPMTTAGWSIFTENQLALVRTGKTAGFTVDTDNLSELLAINNEIPATKPTVTTNFLSYVTAKLQLPGINLLQNRYKTQQLQTKLHRNWRLAIICAIGWLAILLIGHGIELGYFKFEQQQLHKQVIHLYKRVFPTAANMEDPHSDLQAELRRYQGTTSSNPFLTAVSKTGKIINKLAFINLNALTWQEKRLQIKVTCATFAELDQFTQQLTTEGLKVTRNSATTEDKIITATLTIS